MPVEGLDFEALLAPISEEAPAGIDVRTDFTPTSLYFRLRDARAEARAAERAADASPGSESGAGDHWRNVRQLATKILAEEAKDLEAAAWLTEALVRSDGLSGLAFGAALITGLVERYWDHLYPMPDEDGIETRVAPVTGLNGEGGDGTLIQPLLKLPLFRDANGEPILLFQYEQSAELLTISDQNRLESRLNAGVLPYETVQSAARATPAGVFAALRRDLQAAQSAWVAMGLAFDQAAGAYSPPTRRIGDTLDKVATIVERYAAAPTAEAVPEDSEPEAASGGPAAAAPGKARKLATREDALASLAEIADYFRRAEPQSPLAYTIDEAIRRGRMSWPELLAELVKDDQVRSNILTSLGIKVSD